MSGAPEKTVKLIALVFSLLNAALLAWRIHCEDGALALRRQAQ